MKLFSAVVPLALISASGLIALLPGAAGQAPVPTLQVGKTVGYGTTVDLGVLVNPLLDQLRQQDARDNNITINELSFSGSFDTWTVVEVTEKTQTYYGIKRDAASGLKSRFILNETSTQFPAPGTYTGITGPFGSCTPPMIPMVTKTLSVSYDLIFLETSSGISKWNVSDLALREATRNFTVDLRAVISARNVPSINLNHTTCKETVSYTDYDLTITVDVDGQSRVVYSPALDLFDFPIANNETWYANSTATAAGTFTGTVDVRGLKPDDERRFFDDLNRSLNSQPGFAVAGLDGFPIDLKRITVTVGAVRYFENGVLHDYSTPVHLVEHATQAQMTLADGQFHTVYLISAPPSASYPPGPMPTAAWVYSPDDGLIVGYTLQVAPGVPVFELKNVPAAAAQSGIDSTKGKYVVNPPAAGNPILDFFLKPPYAGLLLVVVAILIAAFLVVRYRRRPAKVPPGPEGPLAAPPPESPPPPQGP